VLSSGKPDFPFCLCWANENWTRTWEGGERNVLMKQGFDHDDDRAHIRALIPALGDPRYIRVGGRPLLLVYRTALLPDPVRTAEIWREEAHAAGVGELHLARVEGFDQSTDPAAIGFDAAVEFAPDWRRLGLRRLLTRKWGRENTVCRYDAMVRRMLAKAKPRFKRYRCVTPSFDNSPRRLVDATALIGSTPEKYGRWLERVARDTLEENAGDERLLFVNAWNEWGEGNFLEPDATWGRGYLEATREALMRARRPEADT
jgi:lipopolysaccharide biosynthesis protein